MAFTDQASEKPGIHMPERPQSPNPARSPQATPHRGLMGTITDAVSHLLPAKVTNTENPIRLSQITEINLAKGLTGSSAKGAVPRTEPFTAEELFKLLGGDPNKDTDAFAKLNVELDKLVAEGGATPVISELGIPGFQPVPDALKAISIRNPYAELDTAARQAEAAKDTQHVNDVLGKK
jgi:hypothetical protein